MDTVQPLAIRELPMSNDKIRPATFPDPPIDEPDLLWQPGRKLDDEEAHDQPRAVSDRELAAYRRGELETSDRERVEDSLIRDPSLRARLASEAGASTPQAPRRTRERVLERFEREFTPAGDTGKVLAWPKKASHGRRAGWIGLAASLLLAVLWLQTPAEPLPPGLHWQIEAHGAADVRGSESEVTDLVLTADTRLRLDAGPTTAVDGIEFALFRSRDGRPPERLTLTPDMLYTDRGAARIETRAGDLLGSGPESGRLILVAARHGRVPSAEKLAESHSRDGSQTSVSTPTWQAYWIPYRLSSP